MEGSPPGYTNSNNVQFHFTADPNFTTQTEAYLKAKHDDLSKKLVEDANISSDALSMAPPVKATAAEVYQSLYGNPGV